MGFLDSILGGGIGKIFDGVKGIINQFKLAPEEKAKLDLELVQLEFEAQKLIETSFQAEMNAKKDIIVAELQYGDKFTKRARPTIIYTGLFMAFHNYCLPIWFNYFGLKPMISIEIPDIFWGLWGGVVGAYTLGRSWEKKNGGTGNKGFSLITGTKLK